MKSKPKPKCPHCAHDLTPAELARLLGSLGAGRRKPYTAAERARRRRRLAAARQARWK